MLTVYSQQDYRPITPASSPFRASVDTSHYGEDIQSDSIHSQYLGVTSPTQPLYRHPVKAEWQSIEIPSPPETASFDAERFDIFDYQQASSVEHSESNNPQAHRDNGQSSSPQHASDVQLPSESSQKLPILPMASRRGSHRKTPSTPSRPKLSPRAASIGNLKLDSRVHASINETGVTVDEIAAFIHGPDPEDGKWVCLHERCGRRFGRKENIKSHVQTHLGDRQYKCDHCSKCFVRGHDLKRHAKIHTGDKPYECLCGNVFARHDALTRHRQRGMCIGGYRGVVRKISKRGRPRKARPEMGERVEKAAKTRARAAAKTTATSSVSGSDFSDLDSSPAQSFRNMHIGDSSRSETTPPLPNYSLPPSALNFTPPASPGYNESNTSSDWSFRSLTPLTDDGKLQPIKPLPNIPELGEMPALDAGMPGDSLANSSDILLSSPQHAPTLTDSSAPSDLDVFIDPTTSLTAKDGLPYFGDPDMVGFSDYHTAGFGETTDLFSGKGISTNPSMSDDDFLSLQFHGDDQPSDVFTRDLFLG